MRPVLFAALLALLAMLAAAPSFSQQPPAGPAPAAAPAAPPAAAPPAAEPAMPRAEVERLLGTLRDEERRNAFIQTLEGMLQAQGAAPREPEPPALLPPNSVGAQVLLALSDRLGEVSAWLVAAGQALVEIPDALYWLYWQFADPVSRAALFRIVGTVLMLLGLGILAEYVATRLLARARNAIEQRPAETWFARLPLVVLRFLLDLVPVAAFAAVSYGLISVVDPDPITRVVLLGLNNAYMISRAILCLDRMLMAPSASQLRLIPCTDETAAYVHLWVRRIVLVGIFGYAVLEAALLLGLGYGAYLVLQRLLGLLIALFLMIIVMQNRAQISATIRAEPEARGAWALARNRIADVWHLLAIAYIAAGWLVVALRIQDGFERMLRVSVLSVMIFLFAKAAMLLIDRGISWLFGVSAELRHRYPGLEARANRYVPALRRILGGVVLFMATVAFLQVWGFSSFAWLAGGTGRRLVGAIVSIGITIGIALMIWETLNAAIQRQLDRLTHNAQQAGSARVRTLLPMARTALLIVIVIISGLIVLSELGVNIAPLLAGAGVIGLAIGFGSQKLVQDIITGIFLLLEDAVAVGDVIQINGQSGVVEALSIRTIKLRGVDGSVHIIPFSAVGSVTNMTKDFNFAVFDMSVDYGEDVDRVIEVMKSVGAEMQADPAWNYAILAPLEVMGLERFADSAQIVRARFKGLPRQKWNVSREYNRRLKKRFDLEGIEIPYPHQKLMIAGPNPHPAQPAIELPGQEPPAPEPGPARA
ncbi:MAG: mechanosensitive ion channel [Alphaproteobacteria bacterium]|nr:mechanosensitive ion channel [Alphaproteobacteria bacterium]